MAMRTFNHLPGGFTWEGDMPIAMLAFALGFGAHFILRRRRACVCFTNLNLRLPKISSRKNQPGRGPSRRTRRAASQNPNGIPSQSPAVARHELPWVNVRNSSQPQRGCVLSDTRPIATTPLGLESFYPVHPG